MMITCLEAEQLLAQETFDSGLLQRANQLRETWLGKQVDLCAIINVKSGQCSEDCAYCAQSKFHASSAATFDLLDKETVLQAAQAMEAAGAKRFALVSSGRGIVPGKSLDKMVDLVAALREQTTLKLCASLGIADETVFSRLKEAGLTRYHHNLETAASHYAKICTTHLFADRVATIQAARRSGLTVCSGVIWGVGESRKQRVEVAEVLRTIGVDSVPINLLKAIPGTPLADQEPLSVWEILKTIAVYRLMLPEVNLRLCGGREANLGEFQALAMLSGINGLMLGNYLTTEGRRPEEDRKMLTNMGFAF